PVRVECYDISNIQGKAPVGSMVVAENSVPNPKEYRRFKVKYQPESPDDFAMMNEVILRRLRAYVDSDPKFSVLPDLIVIDGGKGQLSAAIKARDKLGVQVPMVGLAKKQEILYTEAPSSSDVCADEEGVGGGDIPFPLSDGSGRVGEGVGDGGYGAQESDKSRNLADDRHPQP
ncbi:MAG: hypothetical protein JNM34_13345, partial [Chthonomonadaceae bacterium]|nr:hypothetical protein [Chthonomonadaceae bacterium]